MVLAQTPTEIKRRESRSRHTRTTDLTKVRGQFTRGKFVCKWCWDHREREAEREEKGEKTEKKEEEKGKQKVKAKREQQPRMKRKK